MLAHHIFRMMGFWVGGNFIASFIFELTISMGSLKDTCL
jgi:hypothetical protein